MDKRIKKTKHSIKEALFKIGRDKGMENVSIQNIIEEADINRATFYYHYKDKYDLLNEILNETLAGLRNDLVIDKQCQSYVDIVYPPVLATFEHVEKHMVVYKIILSHNGLSEIREKMIEIIKQSVKNNALQLQENNLDIKIDNWFIENVIAGSIVTLIMDWITNDVPIKPIFIAEQMAHLLTEGIFK